ncbi:MAG TPA: hypothetical protein ENI33_06865 [Thermoplasmatales archaeon]|nr:hypothetical protein [Thermoplasmatales archaeon]
MKKRKFLFLTPDGVTYSSCNEPYPDVENLQVLGWAEGFNEEEAFNTFLRDSKWVYETGFREIMCVEIKHPIRKSKRFFVDHQQEKKSHLCPKK